MEAWLHGCKAWEAGIRIAQQVCGNQQNTHSRKHEKVAWTGISVGWITRVQNYSRRNQVMLHAINIRKPTDSSQKAKQFFTLLDVCVSSW